MEHESQDDQNFNRKRPKRDRSTSKPKKQPMTNIEKKKRYIEKNGRTSILFQIYGIIDKSKFLEDDESDPMLVLREYFYNTFRTYLQSKPSIEAFSYNILTPKFTLKKKNEGVEVED